MHAVLALLCMVKYVKYGVYRKVERERVSRVCDRGSECWWNFNDPSFYIDERRSTIVALAVVFIQGLTGGGSGGCGGGGGGCGGGGSGGGGGGSSG